MSRMKQADLNLLYLVLETLNSYELKCELTDMELEIKKRFTNFINKQKETNQQLTERAKYDMKKYRSTESGLEASRKSWREYYKRKKEQQKKTI